MTNLRELLGDDRYHDVIIKATKRALFNYPNLPIGIEQHEALAGQALAAVLPDLLARAWDEGRRAGANLDLSIGERVVGVRADWPAVPPNPDRQEADHA